MRKDQHTVSSAEYSRYQMGETQPVVGVSKGRWAGLIVLCAALFLEARRYTCRTNFGVSRPCHIAAGHLCGNRTSYPRTNAPFGYFPFAHTHERKSGGTNLSSRIY